MQALVPARDVRRLPLRLSMTNRSQRRLGWPPPAVPGQPGQTGEQPSAVLRVPPVDHPRRDGFTPVVARNGTLMPPGAPPARRAKHHDSKNIWASRWPPPRPVAPLSMGVAVPPMSSVAKSGRLGQRRTGVDSKSCLLMATALQCSGPQ